MAVGSAGHGRRWFRLVHSDRAALHGLCAGRLPALVRPKTPDRTLRTPVDIDLPRIRPPHHPRIACRDSVQHWRAASLRFVTALIGPARPPLPLASHQIALNTVR